MPPAVVARLAAHLADLGCLARRRLWRYCTSHPSLPRGRSATFTDALQRDFERLSLRLHLLNVSRQFRNLSMQDVCYISHDVDRSREPTSSQRTRRGATCCRSTLELP